MLRLWDSDIGWPVEELWVDGDVLSFADSVDAGCVVMVLNVPPEKAPWLVINRAGEWAGDQLRLGKRPLHWCYRPLEWPVWNHEHRRLVRFWSADTGLDETVIDALQARRFGGLDVVEPTGDALARQLRTELAVSRRHLRQVLERYWDYGWRKRHKGYDVNPEDHLWRAATAVSDMQDALDGLDALDALDGLDGLDALDGLDGLDPKSE